MYTKYSTIEIVIMFIMALIVGFGEAWLIAKILSWFFGFKMTAKVVFGVWFAMWLVNIAAKSKK